MLLPGGEFGDGGGDADLVGFGVGIHGRGDVALGQGDVFILEGGRGGKLLGGQLAEIVKGDIRQVGGAEPGGLGVGGGKGDDVQDGPGKAVNVIALAAVDTWINKEGAGGAGLEFPLGYVAAVGQALPGGGQIVGGAVPGLVPTDRRLTKL